MARKAACPANPGAISSPERCRSRSMSDLGRRPRARQAPAACGSCRSVMHSRMDADDFVLTDNRGACSGRRWHGEVRRRSQQQVDDLGVFWPICRASTNATCVIRSCPSCMAIPHSNHLQRQKIATIEPYGAATFCVAPAGLDPCWIRAGGGLTASATAPISRPRCTATPCVWCAPASGR